MMGKEHRAATVSAKPNVTMLPATPQAVPDQSVPRAPRMRLTHLFMPASLLGASSLPIALQDKVLVHIVVESPTHCRLAWTLPPPKMTVVSVTSRGIGRSVDPGRVRRKLQPFCLRAVSMLKWS